MREKEDRSERRSQAEPSDCCAMRPRATVALELRIRGLRAQADELEALLNQMPRELTPDADEALWQLLQK